MGDYPSPAVERAMKVQEVIMRAIDGRIQWWQAAEILGVSCRTMRRWKWRYEQHGYDGLFDRRHQRPSPKRVPLATVKEVLRLYRQQYHDTGTDTLSNLLHRRIDTTVGRVFSNFRRFVTPEASLLTGRLLLI